MEDYYALSAILQVKGETEMKHTAGPRKRVIASLVFDATVIVMALLGRITWPEAILFMFCLTTCDFVTGS